MNYSAKLLHSLTSHTPENVNLATISSYIYQWLNSEERREGGMMSTASMNIHRVVRSLAVATVLVGLWLSATTPVRATGPYPWSDQPEYQSDYQQRQAEQFNDRARQNAQASEMEQYRQ